MIYFIKQVVNAVATPLSLAFLLAFLACILHWRTWRKAAQRLYVAAALIAYLGAFEPLATALLVPLERKYPPLSDGQSLPPIGCIVVLGSGYLPRDGIPVTAALDSDGLVRIVEGIRLARRLQPIRLVVSGGASGGMTPPALGYATLAKSLGIDEASLVILSTPLDTQQEAKAIAPVVGTEPFILVTSAYHMPRAMLLMQRIGLRPIAAPTGHRAYQTTFQLLSLVPGSTALENTGRAIHEYIGLTVLNVIGK